MNPAFLVKMRRRIRELRELGVMYKESRTPPKEIRLSMMLTEDEEFSKHGYINFFEECAMIYPLYGKELEEMKKRFEEKEKELYPHLL